MSDGFVLKWEKFSQSITSTFQELWKEECLFDVTLITGTRHLKTHRLLLSACSPVFRDILRNISSNHPYIYLQGVKFEVLSTIIDFIYQGEVVVTQEELNAFLNLAEELQIKGLTQSKDEKTDTASKNKKENRKSSRRTETPTETCRRTPRTEVDVELSGDEIKVSKVVNSKRRRRAKEENDVYRKQTTRYEEEVISDDEDDDDIPSIKRRKPIQDDAHSEDSLGVKTEISITENLPDPLDATELSKLSAECQEDLANLTNSNEISIDDNEHLNTLSEALDNLTKDHIVQVPDKNWKCLKCSQLFYAKLSCQIHVEAEHLDPDSYACTECRQKFPSIKAMRDHVLSGHRKPGEDLQSRDNGAQQDELVQIDVKVADEPEEIDGDIPVINL